MTTTDRESRIRARHAARLRTRLAKGPDSVQMITIVDDDVAWLLAELDSLRAKREEAAEYNLGVVSRLVEELELTNQQVEAERAEVKRLHRGHPAFAALTVAEAEVQRLQTLLGSMDHFAEVAERCEAASNRYAEENRDLLRWKEAAEAAGLSPAPAPSRRRTREGGIAFGKAYDLALAEGRRVSEADVDAVLAERFGGAPGWEEG